MSKDGAAAAQRGHPHYTRHAVASAIAQSSSGNAAASNRGDAPGDEGKLGDPPGPADEEDSEEQGGAPDAEADNGISVAEMRKEMEAMRKEMARMKRAQQQQQQQPQLQSLSLSASPSSSAPLPSSDIAAILRAMQESSAQQAEQMRLQQEAATELARKQQAASAAQLLILQSLGELPSFTGKGGDTTLVAQEWLQRAEDFFTAREQALGTDATLGDRARVLSVATALQDDARRWFTALPLRPATWAEFQDAVKARFCSVPSERIRVDRLTEFIDKAARLRDKLNVQGMQAFTARFAQLAGEVPDDLITGRGKLALLARGLPQRYAEVVLKEESKKPTPPLHQVINSVLSRASQKEQAASYGGASSSPASAAPMNLDAISLAVATFGWTREEAQINLSDSEGWAPHDTDSSALQPSPASSSSSGPASVAPPTPPSISQQIEAAVLNALATHGIAKVGAGPAAREQNRSRRSAPSGMAKEIPSDLFEARKKVGLCCKCGVAKYEPGAGHNSRTCKAPIDKTTSVVDGRKKANF